MRLARFLLLGGVASVVLTLVVASAAVLAVNGGTLAVFTFPAQAHPSPTPKGTPPACRDDHDGPDHDRDDRDDRGNRGNRFQPSAGTPYPAGALGVASAAATARELASSKAGGRDCRDGRDGRGDAPRPRPERFVAPTPASTPRASTGGGGRFLGPPKPSY